MTEMTKCDISVSSVSQKKKNFPKNEFFNLWLLLLHYYGVFKTNFGHSCFSFSKLRSWTPSKLAFFFNLQSLPKKSEHVSALLAMTREWTGFAHDQNSKYVHVLYILRCFQNANILNCSSIRDIVYLQKCLTSTLMPSRYSMIGKVILE